MTESFLYKCFIVFLVVVSAAIQQALHRQSTAGRHAGAPVPRCHGDPHLATRPATCCRVSKDEGSDGICVILWNRQSKKLMNKHVHFMLKINLIIIWSVFFLFRFSFFLISNHGRKGKCKIKSCISWRFSKTMFIWDLCLCVDLMTMFIWDHGLCV